MSKRNKGKNPEILAVAMSAVPVLNDEQSMDDLIASLSTEGVQEPVETVESVEEVIADGGVTESELEAAVAGAEVVETYAAQPGDKSPEEIAAEQKAANEARKAEEKAKRDAERAEKKAKREQEKADAKAERERIAAEKKAAREAEKAAKPKTVYFGQDKVGRLQHTLGEKFGDYMVLTVSDAALTGDDLKAKQDETVAILNAMGQKVKNRAAFLFDFCSGKRAELNRVLQYGLEVLHRDGNIVTGDKGNFHAALIGHPYAPSAARAMGNNTVAMFRLLKLIVPSGDKQTYVANGDSILLSIANSKLGLS